MAAGNGHEALVQLLKAAKVIDVNQMKPRIGTFSLLIIALQQGQAEVQLLTAVDGIDVNQMGPRGSTFPHDSAEWSRRGGSAGEGAADGRERGGEPLFK